MSKPDKPEDTAQGVVIPLRRSVIPIPGGEDHPNPLATGSAKGIVRCLDQPDELPEGGSEKPSHTEQLVLWAQPVDGDALLHEIVTHLNRFVALPDGAAALIALWVLHAHARDAARFSPILALQAPEMGCGKTTALEVIHALVPRPLLTSNASAPALFRAIEKYHPVMMLDEADTCLPHSETMRSILNSGHSRVSARVLRADGGEIRTYDTFCPKVLALIGPMPSTVADRSLVIRLQRKRADEHVQPLLPDDIAVLTELKRKAARWASDARPALMRAQPAMPAGIINREADNWHPLLAIADALGSIWPEQARATARLLSRTGDDRASDGVKLLVDTWAIFQETGTDKIHTRHLLAELKRREERPWADYRQGKAITSHQVAALLSAFDIHPKNVRAGVQKKSLKGYDREDFKDAVARYGPDQSVTPLHASVPAGFADQDERARGPEPRPNGPQNKDCNGVTDPETAPAVVGLVVAGPKHQRWVEKYRPRGLSDLLLPEPLKRELLAMTPASMPNLLLSGPPGTGKTSTAKALIAELGLDCYSLNASLEVSMDVLRGDIQSFASGASLTGAQKALLFEEADNSHHSVQAGMRGFMDNYGQHVRFIYTCNDRRKLIDPLQSRCRVIDFDFFKVSRAELENKALERMRAILARENVRYDEEKVAAIVKAHYPDLRKILIELESANRRGEFA